jgi:hypothetical protein
VKLVDYHKLRRAVQSNAHPGAASELRPLEERLRESLLATGLLVDVEVGRTDDVDHLLIALCSFPAEQDGEQVAAVLERLWQDRLRYGFWEAHATLVDEDQVEFQGATRADQRGHYATFHIVAQKATVPAQRVAPE